IIDFQGEVAALVRVTEAAGGYVKRLVVGPLVAVSAAAAEAVLRAAMQPLYNDKTDYAWNPDVQSIQRRTIHFRIPKANKQMAAILRKFAGEGKCEAGRIEFQNFSTGSSEKIDDSTIFAAEVTY
ncbi:hypothetical protein PFISCL1PPCAC_28630, partial [Pristionchus fissidentatus]